MIDVDVMQDRIRNANPIPHVENLNADELAYFVAATHTRRAAAMQAPTQHPTETEAIPAAAPLPRRRNVWAFAAAFVLVLVVVGAAALLLRGDDTQVTDEPPPSTTVAEETTAPFDVESLIWSRVPLGEEVVGVRLDTDVASADSGFEIAGITAGGSGFVAVGDAVGVGTSGQAVNAVVWTSPDGTDWARLPTFRRPGLQAMVDVTAGGPGLVAVGWTLYETRCEGAAVWTSVDGTTWSRVPQDPEVFCPPESDGGKGSMYSVAAGGPGLVAVGGSQTGAAVWTSPDGVTWTRVPPDPDVFGRHSAMHEVITGGPGFVAIGHLDGEGALWTSPDGFTWSVFPHGLDFTGVAVGGPGFVAVGHVLETTAVVWTSPDGVTWTEVARDPNVFGSVDDRQAMWAVTAAGNGLVAVGTSVWTSPDGITWSRVHDLELPGPEPVGMYIVAAGDDGLVAVGDVDDLNTFWIATPGE